MVPKVKTGFFLPDINRITGQIIIPIVGSDAHHLLIQTKLGFTSSPVGGELWVRQGAHAGIRRSYNVLFSFLHL